MMMLLSVLPITALAYEGADCTDGDGCNHAAVYGGQHFDSLAAALDAAGSGGAATVLKDTETVSNDVGQYMPDGYIQQEADGAAAPLDAENAVASVGSTYYNTLAEAVEAAADDATVVLLEDTSADSVIEIDKNLTLDLNGHVIVNNVTQERLFHITEAVNFTVNGTADGSGMEIPDDNTGSYGFIKICAPATVTLNGGAYTGDTDNGALIYAVQMPAPEDEADGDPLSGANGCTINLNDVTATTNKWALNTDTFNTMTLNVNRGTYTSTAPYWENSSGNATGYDVFGLDCMEIESAEFNFTDVAITTNGCTCVENAGGTATYTNCTFVVLEPTDAEEGLDPGYLSTAVAVSWEGVAKYCQWDIYFLQIRRLRL